MAELKAALDRALSGQSQLVMLAGEPAIGKTRTTQELAALAEDQGAKVLWGWCYEEGSLSLPYLPFVEALRAYVLSREPEDLCQELGSGASDVARIVSEVRDTLQVELRAPGDPEEDRYRLFQAVSDFLGNAASVQPLMLVLEDLHDADRGTLDLLAHLGHNLAGARLFIVGTYRDVEVDRAHPLSGALANLRRISNFSRVLLRGLTLDEVQGMVDAIAGQEIPSELAEAVERQTEGNPLFVQEVLRYLVEEGLVSREGGRWTQTGEESIISQIPEGLRDVIGKRLSRLSDGCNRVLNVAAVIGREFRLDVLLKVADLSEEELYAALEEAQGSVVIEERSAVGGVVSFWFSHAFFKQTLYEEVFTPRRIRLHQQVALALEEVHAIRLEEHAPELAEHFSHSSDPSALAKAIEYGEMAAQRATAVFAYAEGVRHLERCLQVQQVLDPDDKEKRCHLLLALGDALDLAGEPRRIVDEVAPEALSLAEDLDDSIRASRACVLALRGIGNSEGVTTALATSEGAQWAERADRYAQPNTLERAVADSFLGMVGLYAGRPGEGISYVRNALDLARNLDDNAIFWQAASAWLFLATAPQNGEERLRLAEELAARPRAGLRTQTVCGGLTWIGTTFLVWGQRGRAEEVWREMDELAQRTGQAMPLLSSMTGYAILATLDGRLEDAVAKGQSISNLGEELGISGAAAQLSSFASVMPLLYLGKGDDALQQSQIPPTMALCLAHLGRHEDVMALLEELVLARPGIGSDEDETRTERDISLLEAAVLVGHREAAELLLRRFAGTAMRTSGYFVITCIARHQGAAAALLDRPDEARSYYQTALEVCREMPFRPEEALTHLQLAELLLDHYPDERAEALQHLDTALAEFRDMKMQPSLERAVALKERAEAGPVRAPAYPDGLTQREVEVLRSMASGKSNLEIAEELFISINTVARHLTNSFGKIGATNRVEATRYAIQHGLLDSPPA
jgi:DNA-binding CsgD family transcriptional regulator